MRTYLFIFDIHEEEELLLLRYSTLYKARWTDRVVRETKKYGYHLEIMLTGFLFATLLRSL